MLSFVQRRQLGDEQQSTDRPRTTADITRRCFSDCIIIIIIHFDRQPHGTSVTATSRLSFAARHKLLVLRVGYFSATLRLLSVQIRLLLLS